MKYNSDGLVAVTDWYETFLTVFYMGKAKLCFLRRRQRCLITCLTQPTQLTKLLPAPEMRIHRRRSVKLTYVCCCTIYERYDNTCVYTFIV